jgi:hypothetical protein
VCSGYRRLTAQQFAHRSGRYRSINVTVYYLKLRIRSHPRSGTAAWGEPAIAPGKTVCVPPAWGQTTGLD